MSESTRERNLRGMAKRRGIGFHRRTRIVYEPFPFNVRSIVNGPVRYWLTINGEKIGGPNGLTIDEAEAIIRSSTMESRT